MFVVHTISGHGPTTTMDYGHVNQFFRHQPLFRIAKENPLFKECVEQGFIYISKYDVNMFSTGNNRMITYNKRLDLLLEEVAYNRNQSGRR
ncbi:hypothetical protein [Escherichia phage CLB_P2]|nr:hypothetical protein [Escherichia phage CLB_P2]